jgi:hypothetical protein
MLSQLRKSERSFLKPTHLKIVDTENKSNIELFVGE